VTIGHRHSCCGRYKYSVNTNLLNGCYINLVLLRSATLSSTKYKA